MLLGLAFAIVGFIGTAMGLSEFNTEYVENIRDLKACYNPSIDIYYGGQTHQAQTCYIASGHLASTYDCYCVAVSGDGYEHGNCYMTDLISSDRQNCGNILSNYKTALLITIILTSFSLVLLLVFIVIAFLSIFFNYDLGKLCGTNLGQLDESVEERVAHKHQRNERTQFGFDEQNNAENFVTMTAERLKETKNKPSSRSWFKKHQNSSAEDRQHDFIQQTRQHIIEANDLYQALEENTGPPGTSNIMVDSKYGGTGDEKQEQR